ITIAFLPTQFCEYFMSLENRSLRLLLTGGDKLQVFTPRKYRLSNNYGPTENTVVTTSCLVSEYQDNIPIGKPIYNNRVYILGKNNFQLQPIGVPGELCIGGAGLARGYLNNPELTAEKFVFNNKSYKSYRTYKSYFLKKMYRTGDLARWRPDGDIEFLGRIDRQVKIRGFRIELGEIESRLTAEKEIKEAVVIVGESAPGDRYLCAYLVLRETQSAAFRHEFFSELRNRLRRILPDYMIPAYFFPIPKMPLTPNGKVDRKSLPQPTTDTRGEYVAPGSEIEKKLAAIWQDILPTRKNDSNMSPAIGIDSDFFELGGHSLKASLLSAQIWKEFNCQVSLTKIFETPTIRALAQYITANSQGKYFS
ncbi:MAG: non-ribosomal peptide synthetase, partial [Candidatus Aminicenantes bacterium]|nr:non-ribosomal peptide synthetase [Candidatus Aminicenantes bacterium]